MTDKLRVEEIAIGLCKNPTKHGRVTCPYCLPIAQALLSFAKREAEPLVQALVEIKKYSVPPFTGIKWTNLVNDIADKALTAWREKYKKCITRGYCQDYSNKSEKENGMTKHECEYVTDPELGKCDICEEIGEAINKETAHLQKLCEEQKSQLATQTEITEDWKKKYEEYSTYCIALVDCEKEKATQTERVRVLREALIKVKKVYISNVGHTDEGIPHKHCEVCWIDQALQDSLGDGK